jgi:hypothetical protein
MPDKREKMPRPAALADLLTTALRGTPTEKRLKEGKIWLVWNAAVGKEIARRARPVSFRDGTLTVAVSSAPWMQQLAFMKKGIMEKVNACLGEEIVREIYLKAGRTEPVISRNAPEKRHERPLSSEQRQKIAAQTDPIADPELRRALAALLSRHMETNPTD